MKITNIPTEIKTTKTEIAINDVFYNIQVKNNLSINEFNGMCNSIVNSCFDKNNTYLPYLKNQLIKAYTIDYYTDIELSKNSEENSALYNNFGIVNTILENIDFEQYNAILYAIDEMIEMRIKKFDYNDLAVSEMCGILGDIREFLQTVESKMKKFDTNKAIKDLSKFDINKLNGLTGIKAIWDKAVKNNDFNEILGVDSEKSEKSENKEEIVMTKNKE